MLTGRHDEAIAILTSPRFTSVDGGQHFLAFAYMRTGRREEVEKLAVVHKDYPFRMAYICAALGDRRAALDALEQLLERETPQRLGIAMMQPELAMLRNDARWIALRRKLKIPPALSAQPRP